jgi:hypothetical protein
MPIKTRNQLYSGGSVPFEGAADTAPENNNEYGFITKLKISAATGIDAALNRSVWLRTIFYQTFKAFMHKEEDRDIVGDTPSDLTKYVTKNQLPEVILEVNDFLISNTQADGELRDNQAMFELVTDTSGINKVKSLSFSTSGIKWLKARTWLQSEIEDLVVSGSTSTITSIIPVGTIWDYTGAHTVDPDGFLNLCNEYSGSARSISNTAGTGTLHDDKYEALFLHLWTNYGNTECPVSGGRGASAAADWAANKDIKLPDYRGRVGGYYKNLDANFGTLGKQIGVDVIPNAALPVTSPWTASSPVTGGVLGATGTLGDNPDGSSGGTQFVDALNFTGIIVTTTMQPNEGGGAKHFQPTIIQTAIIKY